MSDSSSDLTKEFSSLKIDPSEINVLLLGESGVGKSTFINALTNYLSYSDIQIAKNQQLFAPIPSKFTVRNKHNERQVIKIGVDDNEFSASNSPQTQAIRTYVFPINSRTKIRFIDTSGIGSPQGIEEDDSNLDNVFNYLSSIQEVHAICFFFKPNMSCNAMFSQYCLAQFLSRLDKSCSNNIVFIFTNTRGTDSFSENTITWLQRCVEDIRAKPPYVNIPLDNNIFCFDNEAFRYLAAVKQGVEFDVISVQRYEESWKNSTQQCRK